ncbi:glycosyltransferase [Serratia sp. L9]|uniref:glycosyltransferase n=1 Tax=Serratia sp. L9 TaxID=3423946 RepID=UPI003D67511A
MKIMMIVPSLHNGGAERVVSTFANQLARLGADVHLVLHEDKIEYDIFPEVNVDKLIFDYGATGIKYVLSMFSRIRNLKRKISEVSPDLIVSFLTGCSMQVLISQFFSKNKILVCEHNNYFAIKSPLKRLLRNIIYLRANRISVLTRGDIKHYPFLLRRSIYVQENPLPWEIIQDFESRKWSGKLLAVGRLEHQKNHEELIDIINLCKHKGIDIKLSIVGEGVYYQI